MFRVLNGCSASTRHLGELYSLHWYPHPPFQHSFCKTIREIKHSGTVPKDHGVDNESGCQKETAGWQALARTIPFVSQCLRAQSQGTKGGSGASLRNGRKWRVLWKVRCSADPALLKGRPSLSLPSAIPDTWTSPLISPKSSYRLSKQYRSRHREHTYKWLTCSHTFPMSMPDITNGPPSSAAKPGCSPRTLCTGL